MKQPLFLKTADQLDHWLERFNPLQGATLSTLSGYLSDADAGKFANVMWLARKLIRRDSTIRACLKRINATIQQLDWRVKLMTPLPAGMTESQAQAQADYLSVRYSAIENLTAAYSALARADFYGFAHLEKHYDAAGQVVRLEPVPQWHWCRAGFYGDWLYNAKATPWPADALPIHKSDFIIHECEDPWLEIALISGLDRNQLRRDLRGFCARYGIPNTFFIAGPGATDDDMDALNEVASAMAADGTGALPTGADVKVHESASKGEIFETADKAFQSEIVLAATGGLLTMLTQSGSGTLAGGAHSDTWRDLVSGIAMEVTEAFQAQLDAGWLAERFPGQAVAAYFELEFPEDDEENSDLAATIKTLAEAGYTADAEWVSEKMGIPFTEAADESSDDPYAEEDLMNRFNPVKPAATRAAPTRIHLLKKNGGTRKAFDESKHKRANGRFTSKGWTSAAPSKISRGRKAVTGGMREATADDIKQNAIPPAFKKVMINHDGKGDVIYKAVNENGKKVTGYREGYVEEQQIIKYGRVAFFAKNDAEDLVKKLEQKIISNAPDKMDALKLRMFLQSGFRNGGDGTAGKVRSFGGSSLLSSHARADGSKVHLDFTGKKGVRQRHTLDDPDLANHVRARQKEKKEKLFEGDDAGTLKYLQKMTGKDYKVHDLRTWYGSSLAHATLGRVVEKSGLPQNDNQLKALKKRVAKVVGRALGNDAGMALKSYIHPAVFDGL